MEDVVVRQPLAAGDDQQVGAGRKGVGEVGHHLPEAVAHHLEVVDAQRHPRCRLAEVEAGEDQRVLRTVGVCAEHHQLRGRRFLGAQSGAATAKAAAQRRRRTKRSRGVRRIEPPVQGLGSQLDRPPRPVVAGRAAIYHRASVGAGKETVTPRELRARRASIASTPWRCGCSTTRPCCSRSRTSRRGTASSSSSPASTAASAASRAARSGATAASPASCSRSPRCTSPGSRRRGATWCGSAPSSCCGRRTASPATSRASCSAATSPSSPRLRAGERGQRAALPAARQRRSRRCRRRRPRAGGALLREWVLRLAGVFPPPRECPLCGGGLADGALLPRGGDALLCRRCAGFVRRRRISRRGGRVPAPRGPRGARRDGPRRAAARRARRVERSAARSAAASCSTSSRATRHAADPGGRAARCAIARFALSDPRAA